MKDSFINIEILNRKALDNLIAGLSDMDRDKSIKKGLADGGRVLKKGGINRLRSRMRSSSSGVTGNLLKSFIIRVKRRKPGVMVGFSRLGSHAHLVDLGTTERFRKRKSRRSGGKGGRTGSVMANYFWSDTREEDMNNAARAIESGIVGFVEKVKSKM